MIRPTLPDDSGHDCDISTTLKNTTRSLQCVAPPLWLWSTSAGDSVTSCSARAVAARGPCRNHKRIYRLYCEGELLVRRRGGTNGPCAGADRRAALAQRAVIDRFLVESEHQR